MTKVNWEGWTSREVYINFDKVDYRKGKNLYLRKVLKKNDTTIWYTSLPRQIINDSLTHPRREGNLGPLKN